jgi:hypothetical protein
MPGGVMGTLRVILFVISLSTLIGLFIDTDTDQNKENDKSIAGVFGFLLLFIALWMGSWKIYQCNVKAPDEIVLSGFISAPGDKLPDNYLVLLYLENDEIGRSITSLGEFEKAKSGIDNGYFEIRVPNTYSLTRCDFDIKVKQSSYREGFLWLKGVRYLWHFWKDIDISMQIPLPIKKKGIEYTIIILPQKADDIPVEVRDNPTYLDEDGNIIGRIPITVNSSAGVDNKFYDFCVYLGLCKIEDTSGSLDQFEAWIIDLGFEEVKTTNVSSNYIDLNNCNGPTAMVTGNEIERVYFHEYSFDVSATAGIDLNYGILAAKIGPSFGFSHGQMQTQRANVTLEAPPKTHKRYKVHWHDNWQTGVLLVDTFSRVYEIPFKVKTGISWTVEAFDAVCP